MRVDYEGCAGCCIGWRPVAPTTLDHGRHGPRTSPNDTYNPAPLAHDEVRDFVETGPGSALSPRLWEAPPSEGVEIDGVEIAAVDRRLVFFVGMRKPPKPVALFRLEWVWLRARAFLNPETLQYRTHDTELYPGECAECPGHSPAFERKAECEHVKRHHGDGRLLNDMTLGDLYGPLLGPYTLGVKLFVHPGPKWLAGAIDYLKRRKLMSKDRVEFVSVVVGSYPGSTGAGDGRASRARAKTLESESWVGETTAARDAVAGCLGSTAGDAPDPNEVEVARGVPETPGWNAICDDG